MDAMDSRKITIEEVKKIAQMSKLNIEGDEEKFSQLLSQTLEYIKILDELDTSKVSETFQVTGLTNVYQDGSQKVTLSREDALKNVKEIIRNLVATKGVFDRE
ncbi:MAG: Aspartyl/glutamyl-tRNA(Asn/Gln) amidotransferase subunit C [candidate division WWE3 bacterium GW2011_GWF2_41_45]|uniref:Aspartyl/glutamyl-tRNA(Asn/Gln) amidotransferase subunit C n=3 Tax=Katanobacteria TaxID=422282 RepID=A0A0G0Y2H6_UNCKA|nr:MAG: Aspartyl/glutamyl-tRNA(Asn/Gln) amidotransferase subunit C [candidate division WWE3 bacterium GW2011_GWC2_41_23]KKS10614.1 MAG: Aspartyl/glutamyl-tRNA(Asn/Gln) amidotransferase subunit C [candidate division WWE3 bacterium GW2011_GWF2_41_45]KKS12375.1 MAG: Aspartyl/glutamyl-tRNA(Asn/Gln) amidotransferase subunit C [candidate division WWE3 bacterium GW2011_GWF1_41_53]KKS20449.1 MAG: Aspartyl/glutamyl-tRNA(Asn/Gln) amidotransferase subunit C [candidate division WWE3 bacterium GW2011_GWE1_41